MHELQIILALLFGIVAVTAIADRIGVAYPIALVIGGMIFGALPFTPNLSIDPDLVLLLLLAPALFSAAVSLDWMSFRAQFRPISSLAIRLVLTTTVGVAVVAVLVISGMGWGPAFVLGAIVSPPDAVATVAIIRRLGLPRQLITILEGESLINDATALTLYRTAVAAVVSGTFSIWKSLLQFVVVAVGGVAVGLVIGLIAYWLTLRVARNTSLVVALSILMPFISYLAAEEVGASGVLAVVTTGLVTARQTLAAVSSQSRFQLFEVWNLIGFMTEGFAFALIGLELPIVVKGLTEYTTWDLIGFTAAVIAATVLLRIVWMFWEIGGQIIAPTAANPTVAVPEIGQRGAAIPSGVYRYLFRRDEIADNQRPSLRGAVVISWAGLRGIVTLSTALAIPYTIDSGDAFPHRNLIIFLAFCVILFTLLVQGATLPLVIQRLNFPRRPFPSSKLRDTLQQMSRAGRRRLDELSDEDWVTDEIEQQMRAALESRQRRLDRWQSDGDQSREVMLAFNRLSREIDSAQRVAVRDLERSGEISDTMRRQVERQLDLQELSRSRTE